MNAQLATLPSIESPAAEAAPRLIRSTEDLQRHLRDLAALPESEAPVVSCYLDLGSGPASWQPRLERRARLLRQTTPAAERPYLDAALDRIRDFLPTGVRPESRGLAAFSRAGSEPYFTVLQFAAPTPTSISLDPVPSIYHLIELKDEGTEATVRALRIFEVHLGAVSRELLLRQPDLRRRVGREWTRLHYQNHRRDRDRGFVREKVEALERLVRGKGYARLVLPDESQGLGAICREMSAAA